MPENRKVQKTGGSTYIVSLPKSWVLEKEIEAGDSLILSTQEDGSIVVNPEREYEKKANRKKVEIKEQESESLIRSLIGIYMAGYSKIELKDPSGIDPEMRNAIMDFTRRVIGPEIIEESENRIILRDLIDPSEFSQRKALRRMYLIVKKMHEDAIDSFEEEDDKLASDVIDRDSDVDRLYWMITKHYNMVLSNPKLIESLKISRERSLSYMLVSRALERIGDHASRIAENSSSISDGLKEDLKEEIGEESQIAMDVLEASVDAFFKEDDKRANQAIELRREIENLNDELMLKVKEEKKENVTPLSYILESISRTASYATDISEININYIMSRNQ